MENLFFKVADLLFCVSSADVSNVKKLIPSFSSFQVENTDEAPIMSMYVKENEPEPRPEGEKIGQFSCANGIFQIYRLEQGYKFVISTMQGILAGVLKCDKTFTNCVVILCGDGFTKAYALNNALMTAFTFSAAYHHTIMMHSSVIAHQGFGYMFLGKSGTGKSTHSQLWLKYIPDSELLNDDNPAVRVMENGEAYVYGTPWSGKTPCYRNLRYPIRAIVRLQQSPENEIKKLNKLESFASVISSTSTMIWDKESYNQIISTVENIVMRTTSYHLFCRPDQRAAELSHKTITSTHGAQTVTSK